MEWSDLQQFMKPLCVHSTEPRIMINQHMFLWMNPSLVSELSFDFSLFEFINIYHSKSNNCIVIKFLRKYESGSLRLVKKKKKDEGTVNYVGVNCFHFQKAFNIQNMEGVYNAREENIQKLGNCLLVDLAGS